MLNRTKIVLAVSLAASSLALIPAPAGGLQAKENTPKNSVMVVAANVEEAWGSGDLSNNSDMKAFVRRVLDEYRYRPDILALQEVRQSSARFIAAELSRVSKKNYKVVVMPHPNPYFPMGGRAGAKETSIVANMNTMKVLHKGGYFPTVAKPEHEVEPNDPVLHQAYALLQRRGTQERFATMSVHTLPRGYLANMQLDSYYRNLWAKQMHGLLQRKYGGKKNLTYLMVGDFNQEVCARKAGFKCFKYQPFAKSLMGRGYKDTSKQRGPVDLIWSKGKPGALHNMDSGYERLSRPRYSDHAFRWTILGPDKYSPLPPKPFTTDVRQSKKAPVGPMVEIKWGEASDRAGSGVKRLQFQKCVAGSTCRNVKPEGQMWHKDYDIKKGDEVTYRIRAIDRAGNKSGWLNRPVDI